MEVLNALKASAFCQWLLGDPYAVQLLLCAHSVGMGVVVGVVLMLDVRVLGYPRAMPVSIFHQALNLAWWGFVLNAVSGIVLFATNGPNLITLWTFQLKMILIVAGGISVWALWRTAKAHPEKGHDFSSGQKRTAVLSTLFWLGAIASGRYIAYTIPPG